MGRFNRYQHRTGLAVHESRRELTRTRAEAYRQRDMYMMFTAALALSSDGVLTITEAMASRITPTLQLTVTRTSDGHIEVRADDPVAMAEPAPATPPELEVREIDEEAPADAAAQ